MTSYYLAVIPRKDLSVFRIVYHLNLTCGHFENRKAKMLPADAVIALDRSGYAERVELRFEAPQEHALCWTCKYAARSVKGL